ncbi:MAG TPA: hypothetical protein VFB45_01720 [Pseudolabrys sp.]|nr:hypothetical protein [Pseudolabrys sp.]
MQDWSNWHVAPERGSVAWLRVISWISLRLGRPAGRVILHLIAAYYLLFAPSGRTASRRYLSRVLERPATWRDIYKHFLCFAATIHDRVYLLNRRFDLFDIEVFGQKLVLDELKNGSGLLLIGAHVGSFEVIRAIGRSNVDLKIVMAMYEENARKLNAALRAISQSAHQDVIGLGRVDSMLKLHEHLDQGSLVGMLGDRTLEGDTMIPVSLFGATASLPMGAFRMAAVLKRPVLFMVGLYVGGNRYQIHFEKIADFSTTPREGRQQDVERAIATFAGLIEKYCRRAPYNWFNFFDVWQTGTKAPSSEGEAA